MLPALLSLFALGVELHPVNAVVIPKPPRDTQTCRKTKVAVLGAGISGITAAKALSNANVTDFLILEHNDYIGGRVHHTAFGRKSDGSQYTVELGANWIEGVGATGDIKNPILVSANSSDIQSTFSDYGSIVTYDHTGKRDYVHLIEEFEGNFTIAQQDAGYLLSNNLQDSSMRAGLSVAGWKPKRNMLAQAAEWFGWDFGVSWPPENCGLQFGVAGDNGTFNRFGHDSYLATDQRGFNTFVKAEAETFLEKGDARLLLDTTVETVEYTSKGVVVHTRDGDCVDAEYAICTFSVGVLQNDVVAFEPRLPAWKREAIEQFQMGTYTKIFMQFNESFWDNGAQYMLYADPEQRGWYPMFQNLAAPGFLEGSNILFATVMEKQAYRVEQQTEEETKAEIMVVLRSMFPDKVIPEPIDFMYPRWGLEE
jgi:polyamine oxidase